MVLSSSLVACFVTLCWKTHVIKRSEKEKILKNLLVARAHPQTTEYVDTINVIDFVFRKNKVVLEAKKKLMDAYKGREDNICIAPRLANLIKAIADDLRYKCGDELLSETYFPQWLSGPFIAGPRMDCQSKSYHGESSDKLAKHLRDKYS